MILSIEISFRLVAPNRPNFIVNYFAGDFREHLIDVT
jgi:hypothetical protein